MFHEGSFKCSEWHDFSKQTNAYTLYVFIYVNKYVYLYVLNKYIKDIYNIEKYT